MADIVERLRGPAPHMIGPLMDDAADEIERLRERVEMVMSINHQQGDEIERLHKHVSDALAVLNACRITIKARDQRPDEMKLLDAIKIVIAEIEP